jgi:hypothetical protein
MEHREQPLIIILADISGYTKFMVENHLSAVHGQMIITHLIESLLNEVDIPLELQEIEGDAVFLFATRPEDDAEWDEVLQQVQTKLVRFFDVFIEAMVGIGEMTACECAICTHADELKLKVIAHSGQAVFHSIGNLRQVSGKDVILAHRLLKNSVPGDEYLLLSDAAYEEFGRSMGLDFQEQQESYESFGTVKTHVHFLGPQIDRARDEFYELEPEGEKAAIRAYMRVGTLGTFKAGLQQLVRPGSDTGIVRRILFVLAMPFYAIYMAFRYPAAVAKKLEMQRALRASNQQ